MKNSTTNKNHYTKQDLEDAFDAGFKYMYDRTENGSPFGHSPDFDEWFKITYKNIKNDDKLKND